jgi:glycosyltransferase involved in cell wall biosynthesis
MLATFADVTLITIDDRSRAAATDRRIAELGLGERVVHVTVPYPRWWPRAMRRFGRLSYIAWHLGMVGPVRESGLRFDIAWHVTLANVWMGSAGYRLARTFVLGPVGGGVGTPWSTVSAIGPAGVLFEINRTIARAAGRWLNPLARAAWSHASLILAQNPETLAWLPADARRRAVVFPHIALEPDSHDDGRERARPGRDPDSPGAVTVGRLLPWKGIALAIRAMVYLPRWRLTVIGDGPDRARLEELAASRGVRGRVEFAGWLTRDAVHERVAAADVLLFPSLHEEGGWAAAEALHLGVPVIALDRGGPRQLGASCVPATSPERTARAIAAIAEKAAAAPTRFGDDAWTLERRRDALVELLGERGILP